jgi:SpoVK/Ycf46/Vps4 family AAA+-type ATPase
VHEFIIHDSVVVSVRSYSGADIAVVCREALLIPIRRLGRATHFKQVTVHDLFLKQLF